MKIAIIISAKKNTGSISVFRDLINEYLTDSKLEVELFYLDNINDLEFKCSSTKINQFGILKSYNYDIVHSTGIRPDFYVFLNKFKFPEKTKFLTTIHSFIEIDLRNSYGWSIARVASIFWFWILKRFDLIVVLTESAKQYYSKRIENNIDVVNNGRSRLELHQISNLEIVKLTEFKSKYFIIATHARISKIKGLDLVIKSLVKLEDCAFVVVGDGPELDNLKRLAKHLNVSDRCLFLGYRKNVGSYFSYYDVFTMPSYSEGMPMALLEAVSFRVPCLTSDIEVFQEMFADDEVIKFISFDTNEFVTKINQMKDTCLRKSIVEAAYKRYLNFYTAEVMAQNYKKLYSKLNLINDIPYQSEV